MSPEPGDTALLLIDLQEPILARGKTNPAETVRARASVLVRAAALLEIPIVLSGVAQGDEPPRFIDEVPGAPIPRTRPGALDDEATFAAIKATGRRGLAIGGVLTEVATYAAAVGAVREGFDVVLLVDACSGASERTEAAVLETLGLSGVRILPVASFLAGLIENFGEEPGKSLLPLVRQTYA